MQLIETAPHEFAAHYLFTRYGMEPFFAIDSRIKEGDGSQRGSFEYRGEKWDVSLSSRDSGLAHPGSHLPSGTEFQLESMREFDLHVQSAEDPIAERSFHAHIAPRWQGMESENGQEISIPDSVDEGVNIHIQGSNIEFTEYLSLIKSADESVGISRHYFLRAHEFSTILDAERYVRVHEEDSGSVHARDGPLAQLGHLLENDRSGRRKLVQFDSDERGRDQPGYYHTTTLGPKQVREAFPDHGLPKEIKHYYAREAVSLDSDRSVAHPKVGVSYQRSFWDEPLGASKADIDTLNEELEETLLSVLSEAGLPVRPGMGTYVEDAYFQPAESDRERNLVELDFTQIKHRQESVVIKHLADGISPTAWDTLEVLVTDGGEVSPKDIAEEADRHPGSVRRALDQIPELVEHEYGSVSLRSKYIADLVHDAVREAKEATRRAAEAGAKAMEAAEKGLDETTSAFIAWAAKHDIDLQDRDSGPLRLEFGAVDEVRRLLREGYELWTGADMPAERFRMATVRYKQETDAGYESVDATEVQSYTTEAWRYLR
ncbi:MarR family transcriptional regulator [Halorhabdus rudnickae]|uniref:MarR family transcriptional regulator n=1 Tax=Halorhabdus rudnickae TaxID=1775544 RepID=UPI001FCE8800|nr:MarR family transcriptional regulator [Halorhabdus rudnickae]